jgi:hypothetical protein
MDQKSSARGDTPPSRSVAPNVQLVSNAEVREFQKLLAAQELDRLTADQNLVTALQLERCEGPVWDVFVRALAEYGLAVMTAWVSSGVIVQKCREKGLRGVKPLPPRGLPAEAAEELACLVVAESILEFKNRAVMANGWQANRGASLKTFFIGRCLIDYVPVYRRWSDEEHPSRAKREREQSFTFDRAKRPNEDVHDLVVARERLDELVRQLPPGVDRDIALLRAEGYTNVEVAELLGLTLPAVKSRIHSMRKRRTSAAKR